MSLEGIVNKANSIASSKLDEKKNSLLEPEQEGPYIQFEQCPHAQEFTCKYIDINGNCSFETCQIDNIDPPRVQLWYFECLICKRTDTAKPAELRAPFCHSCVERMQKVEQLPHNCRYCGASINSPAQWMFSGICDDCDNTIKELLAYWKTKGPWVS